MIVASALSGSAIVFLRFGRRLALGGLGIGLGRTVLLGGGLISLAAVVGDVEARAFEDQPGAGADETFDLALAFLVGTGLQRFVLHRLKNLEGLMALRALVFVGRH